jgi:hypothetical protein
MTRKTKPRWTIYEQRVFELFKDQLPAARVRKNVHVRGRFSKRKRQIDILIAEKTRFGILKTVVDTKLFNRKVDVKAVDALAGFVDDVGAEKGMLITSRGYTQAALRRAFYGPSDLELDILNFSVLQQFQGLTAIPYKGDKAFVVAAPFGWVVDAKQTEGRLCNMYQRGLDLTAAMEKKEFLYINFWNRREDRLTAAELDDRQVAQMKFFGQVGVSRRKTIHRADAVTRLRIAEVKDYKCLEVTGFLEFENVIFFAVLLTPVETQRSNIRRLESVLKQAFPIDFQRDNSDVIATIEEQLEADLAAPQRASLLRDAGHWYRDMDKLHEARKLLEESLALHPHSLGGYRTINELLPVLGGLREKTRTLEVMNHLLRLDPRNPTVFNDCFKFAANWIERSEMLKMIEHLKAEHPNDEIVCANCDFYCGNLLMPDDPASARQRFVAARKIFRRTLPRKHQVFRALRLILRQRP